ncbi:hypothetical protein DFS33DRAFT_29902 [Desarmillaria ectypa]|nr:hypothetical protein DFS33DRAFT_29902 [Desarmillaria ectypa]
MLTLDNACPISLLSPLQFISVFWPTSRAEHFDVVPRRNRFLEVHRLRGCMRVVLVSGYILSALPTAYTKSGDVCCLKLMLSVICFKVSNLVTAVYSFFLSRYPFKRTPLHTSNFSLPRNTAALMLICVGEFRDLMLFYKSTFQVSTSMAGMNLYVLGCPRYLSILMLLVSVEVPSFSHCGEHPCTSSGSPHYQATNESRSALVQSQVPVAIHYPRRSRLASMFVETQNWFDEHRSVNGQNAPR